jgi:hypothetical protein
MKSDLQCSTVAEHVVTAHVPCSIDVAMYDNQSILLLLQQILCKKFQA